MRISLSKKSFILIISLLLTGGYFLLSYKVNKELLKKYELLNSPVIFDSKGELVAIRPNFQGYYNIFLKETPKNIKKLVLAKEDRYFYIHPGFNPFSILRAISGYLKGGSTASSTITQQLAKILLSQTQERNFQNKLSELFGALALETYNKKEDILKMYLNAIYFGNQIQGINLASRYYFNTPPEILPETQIIQLIVSIQAPSFNNPLKEQNIFLAKNFAAKSLKANLKELNFLNIDEVRKNVLSFRFNSKNFFELSSLLKDNYQKCQLTIDDFLTTKVREIILKNITRLSVSESFNSAAIVIKVPENELLAAVGSPNPDYDFFAYKMNMLTKPRQVGSTFKPFIYLKGFEKGLRPYTLVDDREYRYLTQLGFPLYPKNFDYQYRGQVSLHYALANSLNVPTLKVLEYIGLDNFYKFIKDKLNFQPIQNLETYQLGIALGTFEMSLFDLAKYFTIFTNEGFLKNIKIVKQGDCAKDYAAYTKMISEKKFIQLINKILSDRLTAQDQFGLKSNLNLPYDNYALKTGTSRNFKDSWIIGYTPDFLVGVWVGNADQSSTKELTGQKGAGLIWSEIMQLLLNSNYNRGSLFDFSLVKKMVYNSSEVYGLAGDNFNEKLNLLNEKNYQLITSPHDNDLFLFESGMGISLKSNNNVLWYINNRKVGEGNEFIFKPKEPGFFEIRAEKDNLKEKIKIKIVSP